MKKVNIFFFSLLFVTFVIFTGCGGRTSEVKITVIGVDWSYSLYCLNETKERQRISTLVKNILEAKRLNQSKSFFVKAWKGELRGIPLETIIIMPIASDEVSFREKIYCGRPEELLNYVKDENAILPEKNNYTHKTDFVDFFNLAKNIVQQRLKDLEDRSFAIQKGIVKARTDFILITDGIHDPKGLINVPKIIENVNIKTIQNVYPSFTPENLEKLISLPENTSKIFFIGVPPRLRFEFWEKIMEKKGVKCKFLEYDELTSVNDICNKLY